MNVWRALTAVRNKDPDYFYGHKVETFALFDDKFSQNVLWAVAQTGWDRRIYAIETNICGMPEVTPMVVKRVDRMCGEVNCIQRINITWSFRKIKEERKSPTCVIHVFGSYAKDKITGIEMPIYTSDMEFHGYSADDREGDATAAEAGAVRVCD